MDTNEILTYGALGGVLLLISSGWYLAFFGILFLSLIVLREWLQGAKCQSLARLHGKTVVITGANTGIGYETAKELSLRGAKIITGSRNLEKSQKSAKTITDLTGNPVTPLTLDLSSLKSVRKFVLEVLKITDKIDVLINNAGIMMIEETITEDGNEKQMQVNHIGHFLLTKLLMPVLEKSAPVRIVNVSSLAHTWTKTFDIDDLNLTKSGYGRVKAYANSKLANVLFTKELHRRFKDSNISSFAVHPGSVSTELSGHIEEWFPNWWNQTVGVFLKTFFLKTAQNGAQTSIYCAIAEGLENQSGQYFADCQTTEPSQLALDENLQRRFWTQSEEIIRHQLIAHDIKTSTVLNDEDKAALKIDTSDDDEECEVEIEAHEIESSDEELDADKEALKMASSDEIVDTKNEEESVIPKLIPNEPLIELESNKNIVKEVQETSIVADLKNESNFEDESFTNRTYEINETKVIGDEQVSSSSSSSSDEESEEKELLHNIEKFDKNTLKNVQTIEKAGVPDSEMIEQERQIVENETLENKVLFEKVTEELVKTDELLLQATETKETVNLPDKYDILKEKVEDVLAQEVETFDATSLKSVKTLETDIVEAMKTQENLKKNIENFDSDNLKHTEPIEKITLPTNDDIEKEKEIIETETQANKEVFEKTVLKTLESFDATDLKHVETHETSIQGDSFKEGYNQEKTHQNLLNEIQMLDDVKLAPVKTIEPMSATDLAKSEISRTVVLQEVSTFDTSTLTSVKTLETNTIEAMKAQENLKKNIENFDADNLKPIESIEKISLPTSDDIEQEKEIIETETQANKEVFQKTVLKTLESFDASELKHVEVPETSIDVSGFVQEKAHQKLLSEISMIEDVKLAPVKTVEPMSVTDLAKTELSRNATLERVNSFDKTSLKNTLTEEKVVLPDANAISMEKQQLEREKVLEDIENFEASDLKPTEVNERISLPTEEQIHNERLNRELITEAIAEEITEAGENDNRERTSSGGSGSSGSNQTSSGSSWEKVEDH